MKSYLVITRRPTRKDKMTRRTDGVEPAVVVDGGSSRCLFDRRRRKTERERERERGREFERDEGEMKGKRGGEA